MSNILKSILYFIWSQRSEQCTGIMDSVFVVPVSSLVSGKSGKKGEGNQCMNCFFSASDRDKMDLILEFFFTAGTKLSLFTWCNYVRWLEKLSYKSTIMPRFLKCSVGFRDSLSYLECRSCLWALAPTTRISALSLLNCRKFWAIQCNWYSLWGWVKIVI